MILFFSHCDIQRVIYYIYPLQETRSHDEGQTALHRAASRGGRAVVFALTQAGANLNIKSEANGWNAIHWAARNGDLGTIDVLLGRERAYLCIQDSSGWTPLHVAAMYESHRGIIERLLSRESRSCYHYQSQG